MSEISKIIPPPDLLAKGLDAARKRAEFFSSKSAEIVTNNDASGRNNAGIIAKSQIKIGDGNTNPDAGLQSSIATPGVERIKGAPPSGSDTFDNATTRAMDGQSTLDIRKRVKEKPGQRTESEIEQLIADIPDGASITLKSPKGAPHTYFREEGKFYLESEKDAKRKIDQTYRVRNRLRFQTCTIESTVPLVIEPVPPVALADPAPAIAPIPDPMPAQSVGSPKSSDAPPIANATELQKVNAQPTQEELAEAKDKERKTEERTRLVQDAQTPEELCDIVASFDSVSSNDLEDVSGDELAHYMRGLLDDARKRFFDTYEEFEKAWTIEYPNVPKAYGIQEKFDVFLREKMRLEFSQEGEKKQPTREELAEVKDFDELFAVLEKYDGIQGSGEFYTSERLRDIISNVRKGDRSLDPITNSKGLRGVVKRLLQEEREPYVSGEVFNQEILAEQDARSEKKTHDPGKENIMTPGSPEADEVLKKFGKNAEEALNQGISHLEKQIKELYITTTDRDGKRVESGKLVELRKQYAEAEYQNVGVWQRLREKLGVRKKESDSVPEREVYYQALQQLISLKIDELKLQKNIPPEELKKKMVETLQFFGTESKIKLYEAWTQATMKREGVYAKAVGLCEDFGNQYNKLKLWQKVGLGAVALGTSVATGGGAVATGMLVARRAAAGLGSFAMFEGVFEKMSQKRASNVVQNRAGELMTEMKEEDAEKRLEQLMKTLKGEMSGENLRQELHDRAKGKTLRTLSAAALSFGMMFGIPALGDHIKDTYFGAGVAENTADVAKKGADTAVKAVAENADQVKPPGPGIIAQAKVDRFLQGGADGKVDVPPASPGVAADVVKPPVEAPIPAGIAPSEYTKLINDFVNQDMKVVKGDSVWKISGRMADQMKLTGGARTHFIDALKDKFGDIQLQAGETINFGAKGIDREFIEKALGKSGTLTAEQIHSIEANDAKIAEFARANPDITLTNEGVDQILHSNPSGGVSLTDINGSREQYMPSGGASSGMDSVATAPAEVAPSPAEAPFERPSLVEMRRGSDWFMQVFRVDDQASGKDWVFDKKEILSTKMSDILKVESNGKVSIVENARFNPVQSENLQKFVAELPKTLPDGKATLTDFFRTRPDISVGEYLARVAKAVPQGTRIGLYTTTN